MGILNGMTWKQKISVLTFPIVVGCGRSSLLGGVVTPDLALDRRDLALASDLGAIDMSAVVRADDLSTPNDLSSSDILRHRDLALADLSLPIDLTVGSDLASTPPDLAQSGDMAQRNFKLVFVSSQVYTGNLGGLAGADAKCQGLADSAGFSGTFKAWLTDSSQTAASRLTHSTRPYKLVTGSVVANNWNDLISGSLRHAIDRTEHSDPPPATTGCSPVVPNGIVWTDTLSDGSRGDPSENCGDWTDDIAIASAMGLATLQDDGWSGYCNGGSPTFPMCATTNSIYCFEQ
jgi:hypothetical protein